MVYDLDPEEVDMNYDERDEILIMELIKESELDVHYSSDILSKIWSLTQLYRLYSQIQKKDFADAAIDRITDLINKHKND